MVRWEDEHAYNWLGIVMSLQYRYESMPTWKVILMGPMYLLLVIPLALHTMEWGMNIYCDKAYRLLQKPHGVWDVVKVFAMIPSLPMLAYASPRYMYDKVKERKVKKDNLAQHLNNVMYQEEQGGPRRSAIIPYDVVRPKRDNLSPTKKIITHKMSMTK
jgi:hypothetical protein